LSEGRERERERKREKKRTESHLRKYGVTVLQKSMEAFLN
jgi:hypothetical protein